MEVLYPYITEIERLCRQYHVKSLYAFGSVLTERFNADSDVDLVVDFEDIPVEVYADNYFDFKFSLEDMLKRRIDLLEEKAIRNPYFRKSITPTKQLIYG
ncbi:MAG: nucleotidyltransferase domain-containing protein [Tannerellaceae bacterium]|jgi:predicted nucleotidyltransferase|nr:nucleotidyltransferase domain-containing protein [Tannerellaceae bacterium]